MDLHPHMYTDLGDQRPHDANGRSFRAQIPSLPIPDGFEDDDLYVDELLAYATTNDTLQLLTGGVHVLDFFTRDPDFYEWVLPDAWRAWFAMHRLHDIMDFVLREDLADVISNPAMLWRDKARPPKDLLDYVWSIRRLLLKRDFTDTAERPTMPYHVAVGMKVKKVHEVGSFSNYIDRLATRVEYTTGRKISHLVDFGAGQNYLGRSLANPPISRDVIAVESNNENVEAARLMDLPAAKVAAKLQDQRQVVDHSGVSVAETEPTVDAASTFKMHKHSSVEACSCLTNRPTQQDQRYTVTTTGSIQYISQRLESGDLSPVVTTLKHKAQLSRARLNCDLDERDCPSSINATNTKATTNPPPNLMVISLHSCGNLSHHGLRSLIENPEVSAVSIVGCCYNLATERLSKPIAYVDAVDNGMRSRGRLLDTAGDPQGFPMSNKLFTYPVRPGKTGVHLNITTRMMAVQAPTNWTPEESESFITRHFYRSLLQKVLLDHGIIDRPALHDPNYLGYVAGESPVGHSAASGGLSSGPLIVVGKLGKAAYRSFSAYVRTALAKLSKPGTDQSEVFQKLLDTLTTEELQSYEDGTRHRRKDIGILWTLMAYSAGLAEAIFVVDRWQWLREQDEVAECWVEPVFDYRQSPRNLAVVGIKKWR